MQRPVLLLAALLLTGSALASAAQAAPAGGPGGDAIAPPLAAIQDEPYGAFLIGREAMKSGADRQGAAWLEALAKTYPEQAALRRHGFTAALIAGDLEAAAELAPRVETADDGGLQSLGRLVRADLAMGRGKPSEAVTLLNLPSVSPPYRTVAYLMRPWALAGAGDWTAALAAQDAGPDHFAALLVQLGRARLLEAKGRHGEAEAAYKALATGPVGGALFRLSYGEFLERRGRAAEALAVYDEGLKTEPGEAGLTDARGRVARHGRPPAALGLSAGAAEALVYASATMSEARQSDLAMIYLRLALHLDPANDKAWLMLGESLTQARRPVEAREAWARVSRDSRFWIDARGLIASSLSQSGDVKGAIEHARATVQARPHDVQAQLSLVELLRADNQDTPALAVLDRVVRDEGAKDWRVRYMRALTNDKLGRWSSAEPDLKAALDLSPDQPDIENYLGYTWIDHGDRVKEGMALVEKAVATRPNSGAMQDSLGWANYRLADYPKAVVQLERAVELEPADPAINDHLGDAYWMAGRKVEAGYQWNRVLSLDPDAKLKAQVEQKLKDGLATRAAQR